MNKKLKDILAKLLSSRDAASLSDEDYAFLEKSVGKEAAGAEGDDAPRSLWWHVRELAFRWRNVLELPLDWWYDAMNPILLDAGAPKDQPLETELSRKAPNVTRAGLLTSVRKHLTAEDMNTRQYAAMLVGLARLPELVPLLLESLATGREERNYGQYVIGAQLETLAMLEIEGAETTAERFLKHDDDRIRRAALAVYLLHAGKRSDTELAAALDVRIPNPILLGFPDELVRAAKGGFDLEERLRTLLGNTWRAADFRIMAKMAKEAHLEDFYKELLEHSNFECRIAAALTLANDADAGWGLPHLKKQLDSESDDQVTSALVVAIASLESDPKSFIRARLAGGRIGERCGAACAAMAHGSAFEAEVLALRADADDTVKKYANAAAVVIDKQSAPELVDIRWHELSRHWYPGIFSAACTALETAKVARPDSVTDFFTVSLDRQWPWQKAPNDEALAFYAARPSRLIRRMNSEVTTADNVRIRIHWLAGLIGSAVLDNALELAFDGARNWQELNELYLECRAHGGPLSDIGRVQGMVVTSKQDRVLDLPESDLLPAVVVTMGTDSMVSSRAVMSLTRFGEHAEPYLRMFATFSDIQFAKATANAIGQLGQPGDAFLADVAQIMTGTTHRVVDLANLDMLVGSPAAPLRAKVAEIAGLPENDAAEVKRYLVQLAGDDNDDVVIAALGALASRAGGESWVQDLLLDKSRSDSWSVSRQVVDIMGRSAATKFMPRLLEVLQKASTENDQDLLNRTVKTLEAIAEKNPDRGMIVLDIREPRRVNERYGMSEDFNWSADQRAEALRLLLLALDKRKDAGAAQQAKGKKLLLNKAKTGMPDEGGARQLAPSEFDALALYFKVTFADDETGSIVAEVGEEPTGEILNALLQTDSVVVTSAAWS